MHIISGQYRGRKLISGKSIACRPSKAVVREALFSALGSRVDAEGKSILEGAHVLDICCGTGALSLEALSRGAEFSLMIDNDPASVTVALENIRAFKEVGRTKVLRADAVNLPRAVKPYRLVFIDPPYSQNIGGAILRSLATQGWLEEGALICFEFGRYQPIPSAECFTLEKERHYGKTSLAYLVYHAVAADAEADVAEEEDAQS